MTVSLVGISSAPTHQVSMTTVPVIALGNDGSVRQAPLAVKNTTSTTVSASSTSSALPLTVSSISLASVSSSVGMDQNSVRSNNGRNGALNNNNSHSSSNARRQNKQSQQQQLQKVAASLENNSISQSTSESSVTLTSVLGESLSPVDENSSTTANQTPSDENILINTSTAKLSESVLMSPPVVGEKVCFCIFCFRSYVFFICFLFCVFAPSIFCKHCVNSEDEPFNTTDSAADDTIDESKSSSRCSVTA
jgi:hypothetical protein